MVPVDSCGCEGRNPALRQIVLRVFSRRVESLFVSPVRLDRRLLGDCCSLDLAARPPLERLFLSLDPTRLERVIVDIRQVTFFDSTGLNIAHRLDRWGREHGVAVLFTRAIPEVTRGLLAAGLTLSLTFSDAPEDQLPTRSLPPEG